jgi:hypothetical protein
MICRDGPPLVSNAMSIFSKAASRPPAAPTPPNPPATRHEIDVRRLRLAATGLANGAADAMAQVWPKSCRCCAVCQDCLNGRKLPGFACTNVVNLLNKPSGLHPLRD